MESIDTLNARLVEHYGDDGAGKAIFRIVFSDDQIEKRKINVKAGVHLLFPEVYEMKKYPYIQGMYILERLVEVPEVDEEELLQIKVSYEPIWCYCDADRNPLYPIWPATQFIVDTLYAALGKKSLAKYVDSEENTTPEGREQRIKKLQGELFGNETETMDAVAYKEGVVVPTNYKKEEVN